jgi:two-component system, OmpR family, response regulator
MKILCVDDERTTLTLTSRAIERACPEDQIITATSGEEAIEILKSMPIDLVITDLMMPGLSGIDVLEAAKRERPNTEVVMVTAYSSVESAVEAMQKGARDYLAKPINIDLLMEKVDNLKELLLSRQEIEDYRYAMAVLEEDVSRTAATTEKRLAEIQGVLESVRDHLDSDSDAETKVARATLALQGLEKVGVS